MDKRILPSTIKWLNILSNCFKSSQSDRQISACHIAWPTAVTQTAFQLSTYPSILSARGKHPYASSLFHCTGRREQWWLTLFLIAAKHLLTSQSLLQAYSCNISLYLYLSENTSFLWAWQPPTTENKLHSQSLCSGLGEERQSPARPFHTGMCRSLHPSDEDTTSHSTRMEQ